MQFIRLPFILIAFFSLSGSLFSQIVEQRNNLAVTIGGDTLISAWGGAMNAPQFSAIDLDQDGKKDIVIFDREDFSFTPYLNTGEPGETQYKYALEYKNTFEDCKCDGWALLVDYNCDGLEDVFCGNNSNVDIYDQVLVNGRVTFEKTYTQVESWYGASHLWLYSAKVDLPAIIDVDDDGDMDFVTWKLGFNTMELHQNMAMEDYGRCDTLLFRENTGCWGHIVENSTTNDITMHDTAFCKLDGFDPRGACMDVMRPGGIPPMDPTESGARHTGSSTLVLDLNGDDVKDALIGDISFNNMVSLMNCGRLDYAYMDSSDNIYPTYNIPVDMAIFPAGFYVDIDNDAIRDLIVATNDTKATENANSVLTYTNQGADNYPDFDFQGGGFIQGDNMEFGSGSAPVFFDYNNDGLLDLLVGNRGYFNRTTGIYEHALALFENIGTTDVPAFSLIDDNYLGITGGPWVGLQALVPAVGDLDGDSDPDLLIGTAAGTLFYFENQAPGGMPADFKYITDQYQMIDVNTGSAPELFDYDTDGDLDLLIGNEKGRVALFKNDGTPTAPNFILETEEWGFIQILDQYGGRFAGNAKPRMVDYDADGVMELLVGGVTGTVEIFELTGNPISDTLVSTGILFNHNVGSFAAPAAAALDSTGQLTYLIGNMRGGLHLFNALPKVIGNTVGLDDTPFGKEIGLRIFPNPTQGELNITWDQPTGSEPIQISVFNALGQKIHDTHPRGNELLLDLTGQSSGLYLVRVESGGRGVVKKVLVR